MKRIYKKALLLIPFAISLQANYSNAQIYQVDSNSHQLNDVIISENRLKIPFGSQNRNITILDKEQIDALPVQSLNELLTYITGVDVRQRGPFGSQADISIDGGTFEQVTVLVNGIKMNDPQTGHNTMNIPIPVNAIDRIEVLRGASARIYGVNSLTGAINIITTQPNRTGAEVQVNGGTNFIKNEENDSKNYYSQGVHLMGSYADEIQNHLVAGSSQNSTGHRYNTAFKNQKIFYQGNMNIDPRNNITVMGGYVYNNFGSNGFYAAPIDKESLEITETAIGSISYKSQLNERLSISPQVSYRYSYDDYRFYRDDLSKSRNQHYVHSFSPEINANYQTSYGEFGAGLEGRFEKINSSNLGNNKRDNLGAYAEFRTEEIENIQISAGAYVNYNSAFGWRVYPGLDVGYSLSDDWKVYVNTGTGQRLPSFTDLHYDTPGNMGNENLLPENAWYAEGGIKYNTGNLTMNASYFYREIDNFIDWVRNDAQDPWNSQNFLKNNVKGLSFNADYRLKRSEDWSILTGIGYTYLDANVKQKNNLYTFSKYGLENLKHQATAKLLVAYKSFHFTATERFQERLAKKSYFLTDARIAYGFQRYNLFVDASNLFNTEYIEIAMAPMPGRWYNIGLKLAL